LRVVDASIMPTIVDCSTTAATMMIGEKAADFIRADRVERTS
jgi:choline dehydrogenase-like flavoprotein